MLINPELIQYCGADKVLLKHSLQPAAVQVARWLGSQELVEPQFILNYLRSFESTVLLSQDRIKCVLRCYNFLKQCNLLGTPKIPVLTSEGYMKNSAYVYIDDLSNSTTCLPSIKGDLGLD